MLLDRRGKLARENVMSDRYIRNPDVVLREEDPDGGLLFSPDTNQIKVLNASGLLVWKLCDGSRDLPKIISQIQESFDDVPEDQVVEQITEFIHTMIAVELIGTV
jgi:hypothetical protein